MGVLACDRVYCENIMCSRVSDDYGYICDDCFHDLVGYYQSDPQISIRRFMNGEYSNSGVSRVQAVNHLNTVFRA